MLKTLGLSNFKCFSNQRIDLSAVTLLAGQNGMGKSTVLQSLLMLRQSESVLRIGELLPSHAAETRPLEHDKVAASLNLNGRLVTCGTARDLLHEHATSDEVELRLQWDSGAVITLGFDASGHERDTMKVVRVAGVGHPAAPFGGQMPYLAAERQGPRMIHALSTYHVDDLEEVGHDGAYAVAFLEAHGAREVVAPMIRPEVHPSLALQVEAWMGEISPGIRFQTQHVQEVNAAALGISFSSGRATSRAFRPTSVGFGVSYTLPVVLTLLAARPGALILVENPEAHLHPRGQMAMGELIARAGAAGIQVIVETHSDHVVNGVRLAVKDRKVRRDQVQFNYFTRRDDGDRLVHEVVSPRIDADGRLDQWPDGFFDQWDLALERLL